VSSTVEILNWSVDKFLSIIYDEEDSSMDLIDQFAFTGLLLENNIFSISMKWKDYDLSKFLFLDLLNDLKSFFLLQKQTFMNVAALTSASSSSASGSSSPLKRLASMKLIKPTIEFSIESVLKVLSLCVPELDFKDLIDEWIILIKQLFKIDRLGLYSLDRDNNLMYLFTSEIANASSSSSSSSSSSASVASGASNQPSGTAAVSTTTSHRQVSTIRMPLKGVAAHVAKTNKILNIEDCYKSEFFDSAMDVKAGYRTQQMLCIPIQNSIKQVIGVLQLINPNPSRNFCKEDEILATLMGRLLSPYLIDLQFKTRNYTIYRPIYHCEGFLSFSLKRLFTKLTNRHLKYVIRVVIGGKNVIPIKTSTQLFNVQMFDNKAAATTIAASRRSSSEEKEDSSSSSSLNVCDLNQFIEFSNLSLTSLTPSTMIIIEFFSKNNHPTGWTTFPLFQFSRYFQSSSVVSIPLLKDGCPEDWSLAMLQYQSCQRFFDYQGGGNNNHNNSPLSNIPSQYHDYTKKLEELSCGLIEIEILNNNNSYYEDEQRIPFRIYSSISSENNSSSPYVPSSSLPIPQSRRFSSLLEWLNSCTNIPEMKRKKFYSQISFLSCYYLSSKSIHMTLPPVPSNSGAVTAANVSSSINHPNIIDNETKDFLWNYRDLFLEQFPSYFVMFLLTILDFTQRSHIKWLLSKLSSPFSFNSSDHTSSSNMILSIPTVLTLLDNRLAFGKLTSFAISSLTTSLSSTSSTVANSGSINVI
jgi:hypothetical protein